MSRIAGVLIACAITLVIAAPASADPPLDTTPPQPQGQPTLGTLVFAENTWWTNQTSVSIDLPAVTDDQSGVASVRLQMVLWGATPDPGGWTEVGYTQNELTWPIGNCDCGLFLDVEYGDAAGNWSAPQVVQIGEDHTPPDVPDVDVLWYFSQGLEDVSASLADGHTRSFMRVSNSPALDADGMLVYGRNTSDLLWGWDLTDPATGGNDIDGPHDIWVQFEDYAGNWGRLGGKEVILDTKAPVVDGARASFAQGYDASPPYVGVRWDVAATDANCRIDCATGGEAKVSPDGTTWDTNNVFAGPGAYQVQARQTDWAGNTSAWTPVAPVALFERQDSSRSAHYTGSWTAGTPTAAYGGTVRRTTQNGATMTTTVNASNLMVVGKKTRRGGSVRVFLDGVLRGTVSERGSGVVPLLRANWGAIGEHTVKLVAVTPGGDHRVTFDAIIMLRQE